LANSDAQEVIYKIKRPVALVNAFLASFERFPPSFNLLFTILATTAYLISKITMKIRTSQYLRGLKL